MAKVALVLVLSLMLLLSFHSALGDGVQMRTTVLPGGATAPATSMSSSQNQPSPTESKGASWTSWLKSKFTNIGFGRGHGASGGGPNAAPAKAPAAA